MTEITLNTLQTRNSFICSYLLSVVYCDLVSNGQTFLKCPSHCSSQTEVSEMPDRPKKVATFGIDFFKFGI